MLLILCWMTACSSPPPPGPTHCAALAPESMPVPPPRLDRQAAETSRTHLEAWVSWIAAPEHGGRRAGSPGARRVAAVLAESFLDLGLTPPFAGSFCQPYPFQGQTDVNVVGHLVPAAPSSEPAVVLGAHYDGLGLHPRGPAFPGADDNATGVAALLETARLLRRQSEPLPFEVVFVAFGAEEVGMAGSRAYVAGPSLPLSRVALMINVDMVGRRPEGSTGDLGFAFLAPGADELAAALRRAAERSGTSVWPNPELQDDGHPRSDSSIFAPHVPALFLSTGTHADQHQLSDTVERLDLEQTERTVRLLVTLLRELAAPAEDGPPVEPPSLS